MINKSGSAVWKGGLKDGTGVVSTQSGVLSDEPYTFAKRFEGEGGTNPEELIGAAHASCYSMALSMVLADFDLVADSLATTATVTLDQVDGGFAVTKVHLVLEAKIPGASDADFQKAANGAKEGCPISKLLNADITLDAKLV
ncbi:OsmC family protein [Marinovum sp. 2_MG-2023]|uniref:OsmC family protein n=1 Tax=Roseobacteraceae TaxID=2854170 RepID=UPI001FD00CE1|nr:MULTISPECIES: OsmC family protein [Roseobacteraceae]MCJ7872426.1 OsmC family protein [Phaeobacter sp. J2-8]MDO6729301.1 OsmC family protein [Marinovum sp. 2_MG-2023]MDO6780484.1 OsmC family protein [Marinovum sp. 1_MG-2023]